MLPGQHVIIIGTEVDALRARASGMSFRDTILILLPGVTTVFAYLFRAPLEGTVADNVMKYGCGGLNIDGCRVGSTKRVPGGFSKSQSFGGLASKETGQESGHNPGIGRWPPNMILVHGPDCATAGACQADCPVRHLDTMTGELQPRGNVNPTNRATTTGFTRGGNGLPGTVDYKDAGGASRFFPQFPDLKAALDWLDRLVGSDQATSATSDDAQCPQ